MPQIKCGHCGLTHNSVTEVRNCATGNGPVRPVEQEDPFHSNKLNRIARDGGAPTLVRPSPSRVRHEGERDEKFREVTRLREAVPVGTNDSAMYAVLNDDGELRFYKVDKPSEGKWRGYTFLKVQAGPSFHPIKGLDATISILSKIMADPEKAAAAYGKEIGRCGMCNTELTNTESRARGIGPICAGKQGW